MKSTVIAFILLLTISTLAQHEFKLEHLQSTDNINKVSIDCSRGQIYCEPSDNKEIQVFIKKVIYINDEDDARQIAEACKVRFNENRQTLEVTVDLPHRSHFKRSLFKKIIHGDFSRELEILIKVMLPEGINLDIETSSADIFVSDLGNNNIEVNGSSSDVSLEKIVGEIYIDVSSGDLEAYYIEGNLELNGSSSDYDIGEIKGNIRISTSSGDGIIENTVGDLNIKTSSGEIKAYNLEGNFISRSSSGDVIIEDITGSVKTITSSGTVQLRRLSSRNGKFSVNTNSGDVYIEVSNDFGGMVEIETITGDINTSHDKFKIKHQARKFRSGTIGSGNGEIDIETSSGDISVESY